MIWAACAPPGVGGLHGVLALLPSAQITPVAHARLVQSVPRYRPRYMSKTAIGSKAIDNARLGSGIDKI